jgi:hypothetical protein
LNLWAHFLLELFIKNNSNFRAPTFPVLHDEKFRYAIALILEKNVDRPKQRLQVVAPINIFGKKFQRSKLHNVLNFQTHTDRAFLSGS